MKRILIATGLVLGFVVLSYATAAQTATAVAATATAVWAQQTAIALQTAGTPAQETATQAAIGTATAQYVINATATIVAQTATANATIVQNTQTAIAAGTQTAVAGLTATEVFKENYTATITPTVNITFTKTITATSTPTTIPTTVSGKGIGLLIPIYLTPGVQPIVRAQYRTSTWNMPGGCLVISVPTAYPRPLTGGAGTAGDVTVTVNNVPLIGADVSTSNWDVILQGITLTANPAQYVEVDVNYQLTPLMTPMTTYGTFTWTFKSCQTSDYTAGATALSLNAGHVYQYQATLTLTPTSTLTPINTATPVYTATPVNNPVTVGGTSSAVVIASTSAQVLKGLSILSGAATIHACNCSVTANCAGNVVWTISAPGATIPQGINFSNGLGYYQNTTYNSATNITSTVINSF